MRSARLVAVGLVAVVAVGTARSASKTVDRIETVAGTGVAGRAGDGGPATTAEISHPRGIAAEPGGGYVFAEPFTNTVRRVGPDGVITTLAGTGEAGSAGDGGPAAQAQLSFPHSVSFTAAGGLLVADTLNDRIRLIAPDGTITTAAGTGFAGFSGDGGPATSAQLRSPRGVAATANGGYLVADSDNARIRFVAPDGVITSVAGTGVKGDAGDGGPATQALLSAPFGVAARLDGSFLIADAGANRIRLVAGDGTISTVAGNGSPGFNGDGGAATAAELNAPHNVAVVADGGFLIADTGNQRIRRVGADGTITTLAGVGTQGFSGDGGPAGAAQLNLPKAIAVRTGGAGLFVADSGNNRVRLVSADLRLPFVLRLLGSPVRTRVGRPTVLRYVVSVRAPVRLEVWRASRRVLGVHSRADVAVGTLVFGRTLKPGTYRLRLAATAADGRSARDAGWLIVGKR